MHAFLVVWASAHKSFMKGLWADIPKFYWTADAETCVDN
jgi:hypothetical protein